MRGIIAILLFIIFVLGSNAQTYIYFNSTTDCSHGCSLTNATIYEGGVLPTQTDDVYFNLSSLSPNNNNNNGTWFHLDANETFVVHSLFVIGDVGINIRENASLVAGELHLSNVWLFVHSNASLIIHEEAELEYNSSLIIYGSVHINELSTDSNSSIYAEGNATFTVWELDFENGAIVFLQEANFTSHESEFTTSSLVFYNRPYLGDVEFEGVDAHFPQGFLVEDHYVISNSNFSAYFPDELANVSLILAGHNNLTVSNLIFASNKIKFNNTGSPFITFTVSNNATFNGSIEVPGEIVVSPGSNLTLDGNITLSGGLVADVNAPTHIRAVGALSCGSPVSLIGKNGGQVLDVESAIITAPSIKIDEFTLVAHGPSQLIGHVVNFGVIYLYESNHLYIQGNYTQADNATLGIYNITNSLNRTATLFINGSATLGGLIVYNATETKTEKEYSVTVLQVAEFGNYTNHFHVEDYEGASKPSEFIAKIHYGLKYINLTITPTPSSDDHHHLLGLHWWVWLLIGVGAFLVVLTIVGLVVSRRRRVKYEAVGGRS